MAGQFIAVGDNCLDVYVNRDQCAVGGNALNVAADWRASGLDARYIGVVGDDVAAGLVVAGLRDAGLDAGDVRHLEGATGITYLRLDAGERVILHEELGVVPDLRLTDEEIAELARADWVHLQGTAPEAQLVERFVECGARVSVDLSTYHRRDALEGVEVAFASLAGDSHDAAAELAASIVGAGARRSVVLRGAHGSLFWDGSSWTEQEAERIVPLDTCGAGDSFIASFVAGLAAGRSIDRIMIEATRSASRTCLHLGGFDQTPCATPDWLRNQAVAIGAGGRSTIPFEG